MFSRIFDNKTTELDAQFDNMIEKMKAEQAEHARGLRTRMGMLTNSSGLFGGAITNAAGQSNMMNSLGAVGAQAGILREEPRDHAVRVEYVPVENGYVVNIAKGYNQTAKVYVAKDLAEAHELVTTFMVKERLK